MSTDPEPRSKVLVAPLVPVVLAVMAGIVADRYADPWGTGTWGAAALAGAVIGAGFSRCSPLAYAGLLLTLAALGGEWHHYRWSDLKDDGLALGATAAPTPAWVRGMIWDAAGYRPGAGVDDAGTTRLLVDVTAIHDEGQWRTASGRVQAVIVGDRSDLRAGEAIEAAGSLAAIAGPMNPGEFDYRGRMRAENVRLRLAVDGPSSVRRDPPRDDRPLLRRLGAVRAWSHARLVAGLDPAVAPLAAALLLGRREGVDPEVNDAFARTGTTHLLAISGLHLQVLAGALWFFCRAIGLGRRGGYVTVASATIAYALLVGLMPSVVRSAAMTVIVSLAALRDRRIRPANLLALAGLVTLGLNPSHLFDVGCQLSFLAVAAIIWGVKPATHLVQFAYYTLTFRHQGPGSPLDALERRLEPWWVAQMRRWPLFVTSGVIVSTVVWALALPLVALRFHIVSPVGVLLNIPLVPLTSGALMAAGLSLGLSGLWEPLGMPPAWVSTVFLRWTDVLVRWGATRGWGHRFVAGPSWGWVLGLYALLALAVAAGVCRWRPRRFGWALLAGWIVVGGVRAGLPRRPGPLEADVLAVGHGLAVVIQDGDGRTIVYDCGRMRDPSVGRRIVAPALWARGVDRVEAVILSHADSDHYNGLPDLLDRFSIGSVRVPPGFAGQANPGAVRLLGAIRAHGIAVRPIAEGDHWESSGARFSVRHPPRDRSAPGSDNARSVVLDVESAGRHFLLTGDLEQEGLARLVEQPSRRLDAFLSPHHGGRSANPEWLYAWAQPDRVIVSQRPPGAGASDALASLAGKVALFRTWERGAIRLRWLSDRLDVRGFLDTSQKGAVSVARGGPSRLVFALLEPPGTGTLVAVLGLAAGLLGCFLLTVAEWGAWTLVLPGRRFSSGLVDPLPGEPIEARSGDGVRLSGTWHPAEVATGRTMLMVHGFAEYAAPPASRIETLNRLGWNVARLDMRAYGQSGGDRASFGGREAGDLVVWIDVLAARVGPMLSVAAWGRSMGAAIAIRAAAADPRIAALVLDSPMVDLEAAITIWLRRIRLPAPRLLARLIAWRAQSLAGVSLTRPRPIDVAPAVTAPALIVHGSEDSLVLLSDARRLAAAFPRPALLIEVPGAGHGKVIDVGGPELLDRVAAFLAEAVPWGDVLNEA